MLKISEQFTLNLLSTKEIVVMMVQFTVIVTMCPKSDAAEITLQSYTHPKQDSVHVCCIGLEAQINISNQSEQKKGCNLGELTL